MNKRNRYFLIGYNYKSDLMGGEGMMTLENTDGNFPSIMEIREFVMKDDNIIGENINIVIQNLFEFNNESDYKNFTGIGE